MPKLQSPGTCVFCGAEFSKAAMSRHVSGCAQRARGSEERLAVVVEGKWARGYWLHLEVKPQAKLAEVDHFLRETWLECCGHMSSFEVGDRRFESEPDDFEPDGGESMEVAVSEVLRPGVSIGYVYDWGSSTELALRVLAPRSSEPGRDPVRLVARNVPPPMRCKRGHGDAIHVCSCCGDPVCDACAPRHRCGSEMLLPVVNSPRVGVCAYGT